MFGLILDAVRAVWAAITRTQNLAAENVALCSCSPTSPRGSSECVELSAAAAASILAVMDHAALDRQLRLGEDAANEFKDVARNGFSIDRMDLAKALAAFANSGGGRILLGVSDDGTVTGTGGVQQTDALLRHVTQVCRDLVSPPLSCRPLKVEREGGTVLVVVVPGFAPDRPYLVSGAAYVRDGTQNRKASRDEQIRLLQSADYHFDEQAVEGATSDDFDPDVVKALVVSLDAPGPARSDPARYLEHLHCATAEGTPTVAGVLFLGQAPQRWLAEARVSAVRFPGCEVSGEFLDRVEIDGRLTDQIRGCEEFLARHLAAPSSVEGWERREHGMPSEALREAVMNALVHRDYRMAAQVRVGVFDDRVEIVSPGGLLNRLTIDSIRIGWISQRRNPIIASLLARLARPGRENLGIGIPEMIRRMRERGLPEPEFDVQGGHFRVILRTVPAAPR